MPRRIPPDPPVTDASEREVLMRIGGTRVVCSDHPGLYYCAHMFYVAQKAASRLTSIQRNAQGEKLVGFLHCPTDAAASGAPPATDQAPPSTRHALTRHVLGAALRGYFDTVAPQVTGAIALMVTGYGAFKSVRDNPTGDFVQHRENVDATVRLAFGAHLVEPSIAARVTPADATRRAYSYRVRDDFGAVRALDVHTHWFPVNDTAIDGVGPASVQKSMEAAAVHGIVSLGVHRGRDYRVEHHAHDGGLRQRNGAWLHDEGRPPRDVLADNFSLARAIVSGGNTRRGETPGAALSLA